MEINYLKMTTLRRIVTQCPIQNTAMSGGRSSVSPQTVWDGCCGGGLENLVREVAQGCAVLHFFHHMYTAWTYCHILDHSF